MAYSLYTASFDASNANAKVVIFETSTGAPAIILATATGGVVSRAGIATLDSSANLSVYIDTAKTWTVKVVDVSNNGNTPVVGYRVISATDRASITGQIGVIYLDEVTFAPYYWNGSTMASMAGGGGGAVASVAGKTGVVTLVPADVGGLPNTLVSLQSSFTSLADLNTAITGGQLATMPAGQRLVLSTTPTGSWRIWNGTDANQVEIRPGLVRTLASNLNQVYTTVGAPTSGSSFWGTAVSGDEAVDYANNVYYSRGASAWSVVSGIYPTILTAAQAAAVGALVSKDGTTGVWRNLPASGVIMRVRMTGTGKVSMDSATGALGAGTVTTAAYAATVAGTRIDDYAYPGDAAQSIRFVLSGTAAVEVY